MTEKEKMLKGELYLSFGEELFSERQHAKEVLYDFNNFRPSETEKRNEILKKLFGAIG